MIPLTKFLADKKSDAEMIVQLQEKIILQQEKIRRLEAQNAKMRKSMQSNKAIKK